MGEARPFPGLKILLCCVVCVLSQEDVRVARQGHAAVCHQRRVLVLGGVSEGTEFMNDCLA